MKNNQCITRKNQNDAWRISGSRGDLPAVYQAGGASRRMFAARDGPVFIPQSRKEDCKRLPRSPAVARNDALMLAFRHCDPEARREKPACQRIGLQGGQAISNSGRLLRSSQ